MHVEVQHSAEQSLYTPRMAEIVHVEQMTEKEKLFRLSLDGDSLGHEPGQFVEVSVFGYGEAPISVCSSPSQPDTFDLCVREVGTLTHALHQRWAGDRVGIRGPFGKGFDLELLAGKDLLIIGGGIGLAPLRSVIHWVVDRREDYGKTTILYGTRSPAEILFKDDLQKWEAHPTVDFRMTVDRGDDAWKGHVGVITTLIPPLEIDVKRTYALVVGPPIMYKFVILALAGKKLPDDHVILSLERRMKCGVGKCGHCQMDHFYVCQDGPVFNYARIKDLEEAIR